MTELHVDIVDVRRAMRVAYENRPQLKHLGCSASQHVLKSFTWSKTVEQMIARLQALVSKTKSASSVTLRHLTPSVQSRALDNGSSLCAFVIARSKASTLGNCLAHLAPFVDELVVVATTSDTRSAAIANEYGARVFSNTLHMDAVSVCNAALRDVSSDWLLVLRPAETLAEDEIAKIRRCSAESPAEVLAISLQTEIDENSENSNESELRVFRRNPGLRFHQGHSRGFLPKVGCDQFQIVKLPIALDQV